jgi:hypothetical protein
MVCLNTSPLRRLAVTAVVGNPERVKLNGGSKAQRKGIDSLNGASTCGSLCLATNLSHPCLASVCSSLAFHSRRSDASKKWRDDPY